MRQTACLVVNPIKVTKMAAMPISRVVKFQNDLCGGLLYNNLTIFRKSVWAFSVMEVFCRESRADQK